MKVEVDIENITVFDLRDALAGLQVMIDTRPDKSCFHDDILTGISVIDSLITAIEKR